MEAIEIHLPPDLYHRAESLAAARQCSIQALLTCMVAQAIEDAAPADRLTGFFADEPEIIDEIVEEAMADRERRWATTARE